ncbi:MAG: UDP-N-acetylglucosamine 2-epimerase (non-hydrolyzing) [Cyclobacteriaceae bacterium]|nr:UDP-N-acetylglucosamine 2-epimerase (non-hydrolyzing) [Cyclobacteriaceae bacterium]
MLLFVIGTRPELIKVAPLILELKRRNSESFILVNTGQHKQLLEKYWKAFGIEPDYNLEVILSNQDLSSLTTRAIDQLNNLIKRIVVERGKPNFIISQGDTTTVLAASMVAFYHKIPFAHIEAGLRSFDLMQPYPEEFNRRVASIGAAAHFAPTSIARENLLKENIPNEKIFVVGNSGIDALQIISRSSELENLVFTDARLNEALKAQSSKIVLITCHRRENHENNLLNIISAIAAIAVKRKDCLFVWPIHPNPNVKQVVLSSVLASMSNVILTDPLDYTETIKILSRSFKVITDSGGLQEEAPSFKLPVLILRERTERPEAVDAGYSILVGSDTEKIIENFEHFNPVFSEDFKNPYGDGMTSKRIIDHLIELSDKQNVE